MVELVQLPQGPEDLDAQEEHDHQGGDAQLPLADPHGPPAEGDGGAQGHAQGSQPAGGDVHRQHLHRGPVEVARLLRQEVAPAPALAEDFERGQPLHGVHELRGEHRVGPPPGPAAPPRGGAEEGGGQEGEQGEGEEDEGAGEVQPDHEEEDADRGDGRHHQLREVAPVVGVQLLHGVHRVEQHLPGPLLVQVGRAQLQQVVVDQGPQLHLHPRRRTVGGELLGHHQQHPQDGEEQHPQQDERHLAEGGPLEDHRHRGALHRQPGHPADRRQQPERRGERDPPPHPVLPPGEGEEPPVDVSSGLRRGLTRHGPSPSTRGPRPGPSEGGGTLWGEAPGPAGPACAPPLYCNSLATVRAHCTGGRRCGQALSPSRSGSSADSPPAAGGGVSGGSVAPSGSPPGRLWGRGLC